eukprot:1853655-Rhodomonas_salina.1
MDPFQEDWECALNGLDLGTLLRFSDLATATLQDVNKSWLQATQQTNSVVTSRRSALQEILRHDDELDMSLLADRAFWHGVPCELF